MKATRATPTQPFLPITLTIETEDELRDLLKAAVRGRLEKYVKYGSIDHTMDSLYRALTPYAP